MIIKNPTELANLQRSGAILARALRIVAEAVAPGVSTADLNAVAEQAIREEHGEPAFLGYKGFPATLCTSINTHIVHGIPRTDEILQEGDIIGLDLGVRFEGMYTDMAVTVPIGKVSAEATRLINVTKESLQLALSTVRAGIKTGDLGSAVQQYIEKHRLSVVRDLVGHGVGRHVHEEPMIPNFGTRGRGEVLPEHLVIAIEPMVTMGDWHVETLDDGWTIRTLDNSLAAHFEHTVVVTKDGCTLLTAENGNG